MMLDSAEPVKRARERERDSKNNSKSTSENDSDTLATLGARNVAHLCLSDCLFAILIFSGTNFASALFLSNLQSEWALGVHKTANISITITKLNEATNRILEQFTIN